MVVEVVKQAEDSEDWIVRLYEYANRRTRTRLRLPFPVKKAVLCDMQEQDGQELPIQGDSVSLSLRPFEIQTLRISF